MLNPWIKLAMTKGIWKQTESERPLCRSNTKHIQRKHEAVTVFMGSSLMETPVSDLPLTVRSYNCLRRAGYNTVGEIINSIESEEDLLKIRNLGSKSATEILNSILNHQKVLIQSDSTASSMQTVDSHFDKPSSSSLLFVEDGVMCDEEILW